MKTHKELAIEGISDAVGFLGGALLCFWIGRMLGFDIFDKGYSNASIAGILLIGFGGGTGLKLARVWRSKQSKDTV